jgi:CRP-like cAMP-binding protein
LVDKVKEGEDLHEIRNPRETDLDRLSQLRALSSFSAPELTRLVGALTLSDFRRNDIILHEAVLASDANILLRGIARITCQGDHSQRQTVAILGPGLIPEFPAPPMSRSDFQCEAFSDCRIGSLDWNKLDGILLDSSKAAFKAFHENDLKQWYRLLLRSSSFSNFALHERIGITLLELCSDFGIEDARGTLLRVSFSHHDIADLVGASRPRVTEHLSQLERDHLLIRQGRQFIVRTEKLGESINLHSRNEREIHVAMPGRRFKKTGRSFQSEQEDSPPPHRKKSRKEK